MSEELFPVFPKLQFDAEYIELLPHVIEFCKATGEPFYRCTHDIADSMYMNSTFFTQLGKVDSKIVGYMCGKFISPIEFYVIQAQCALPGLFKLGLAALKERLSLQGIKEIRALLISPAHVRLYKQYGFELKKYYVTMEVT